MNSGKFRGVPSILKFFYEKLRKISVDSYYTALFSKNFVKSITTPTIPRPICFSERFQSLPLVCVAFSFVIPCDLRKSDSTLTVPSSWARAESELSQSWALSVCCHCFAGRRGSQMKMQRKPEADFENIRKNKWEGKLRGEVTDCAKFTENCAV